MRLKRGHSEEAVPSGCALGSYFCCLVCYLAGYSAGCLVGCARREGAAYLGTARGLRLRQGIREQFCCGCCVQAYVLGAAERLCMRIKLMRRGEAGWLQDVRSEESLAGQA